MKARKKQPYKLEKAKHMRKSRVIKFFNLNKSVHESAVNISSLSFELFFFVYDVTLKIHVSSVKIIA